MRLMGVLGALDCYNLFKQERVEASEARNEEIMRVIEVNHKSKFSFERMVC